MFLRTEQEVKYYMRRSKGGKHHTYKRMRTIVVFQCDDCKEEFKRDKGKVDPKRLDNAYYHVCPSCDPKRFAQRKGVEQRKKLNLPVNSEITIEEL